MNSVMQNEPSAVYFKRAFVVAALLVVAGSAPPATAEPTRQLYISDPTEVMSGDPVSTSIDAQGRITVGPTIQVRGSTLGRAITALAPARGGLWVGTAGGGLHRFVKKSSRRVFDTGERVVTALLADGRDAVVALAPNAEVVRVDRKGKRSPLVKLKAKYIWAMASSRKRTLLATGEPGQVVAMTAKNRTEVWFDSKETHLRALIRHPQRGWIVGGGQKGIVYQLVGNKKARALYDSKFEEVTAFAIDPDQGDLYVSFVSAVTAAKPIAERWIGPTKGDKGGQNDKSPFKGSEVVRIRSSGQVEKLWSSNTEGAMSLTFVGRQLYFTTGTAPDQRARIYAIDVADRDRLRLWARLEPALAPVSVMSGDSLLVGTAPTGQMYTVGPGRASKATYLSVEQDLARTARVGRVWFDADLPAGSRVAVSVRSGNTKKPDDTWSQWSAPVTRRDGGSVKVPDARYVQLKAVLTGGKKGGPVLKSMHASLVRHNVAPTVKEVFALRRGISLTSLPVEGPQEKTVSLSKRALEELRRPPKRKRARRVRQRNRPGMMTIAWRATDADGDQLLYRVEMRRLDSPRTAWREVDADREDGYWSFDSRAFADGHYQFRVTATDRPTNPPEAALSDTHISEPILVDNTAPRLSDAKISFPSKTSLLVQAKVVDQQSRIKVAEVSVNGGPWLMLPATDGLLDAKQEALRVTLSANEYKRIKGGSPTVRIRVEDEAGNTTSTSAASTSP